MATDRVLPASQQSTNDTVEDGETEQETVKVLEAQGTFDDLMVWGHETLPAADDTFVKGVEEWVRFAETVGAPRTTLVDTFGIRADSADRCMGRL
jgi:ribonuclease H2 subunit C